MTLSTCLDCGREVSTRAAHCVHCGRPWPSSKCCGLGIVAGVGIAILIAIGSITAIAFHRKHDKEPRTQDTQYQQYQQKALAPDPAPVK